MARTAEELSALIKNRAEKFGNWPASIKLLVVHTGYRDWCALLSPGRTPAEEAFRTSVMWIAVQMEDEFELT